MRGGVGRRRPPDVEHANVSERFHLAVSNTRQGLDAFENTENRPIDDTAGAPQNTYEFLGIRPIGSVVD